MWSGSLAILLVSALAADLPPEALIEHLSSSDRVVREEAARTLEERGSDALPVLRAARDAAQEPEARNRLATVIARVEARLLDRPTMVALDFDDRPLGEAVKALAERTGFSIMLDDPAMASRRVTARAAGQIPFWEALDRLGRAGHVRHDPGFRRDPVGNDPQASTIRLVDGDPPAVTTYAGPLRVHLYATQWHRDVEFGPAAKDYRTTVTVEIQAFAEPGRFIDPAGAARLEAVDEQERVLASQPGGSQWPDPAERSWLIPGRLSLLHWQAALGLPNPSQRTPLRLRGVLPVIVSARRPDPLVIPLADAMGKTFRREGNVVTVESNPANNGRSTSFVLVFSEDADVGHRSRTASGVQPDRLSELLRDRLEIEDAEGHLLNWLLPGQPFAHPNGGLQVFVNISGRDPAVRLRIYELNRLATEIPFAFDDVPAP